jgi:glutathione synthase/RimK-type ligase-like ATP-grasp enzyme
MVSLVIGVKTDPVLRYFFTQSFVQKDRHILFINTERIGCDVSLSDKGWSLPCGGWVPHSAVSAVYNRMLSYNGRNPLNYYLNWLLDDFYPNVINRPRDTLTNFSKLWQLEQAKKLGFRIPETCVLANKRVSRVEKGRYIYKSISSLRSIVAHVDRNRQRAVHEPVLFQSDQGRRNIRVHIFEGQCFPQVILSQEVDYRYDALVEKARVYQLPDNLKERCCDIAKDMNLLFSGVDLIFSQEKYYFLEINPSPGYAYFEKQMRGVPISQCIYNFLKQ